MKLVLENVSLEINHERILENVDLEATVGTPHSIIGPNGSGKTSLLRVIAGIYKPTQGKVRIEGTPEPRRVIYYLPAEPGVFPGLKVIDYLQIALGLKGLYGETGITRVMDILEEFKADKHLYRDLSTLSSGERRLVYLAAAAASDRSIILIDEPTSHLDLKWAITAMNLLMNRLRGKVFIFTTHDVNIASAFSKQTTVISNGRVYASGGPGEVYSRELLRRVYGVDLVEFTDSEGRRFYVPST
ncbi:MAG: ABC transporter ATP-binding protein [Desulfurococcales archaeon]|nr:ABC transporter ATP-binding protein [Desulfurococcales archaeon]